VHHRRAKLATLVAVAALAIGTVAEGQPGVNVALGKPYTMSAKPNYSLTADAGDAVQLTDGKYADAVGKSLWTQKATVGWSSMKFKPLAITLDLGQVEPIDGVSFSTGARQFSGIWWPIAISVRVSENGKDYYDVGNLVRLSRAALPDTASVRKHRFMATGLATKGRWVTLVVQASLMAICDEIEVYRGGQADLATPYAGKPIPVGSLSRADYLTREGCARRFQLDLSTASRQLDAAALDPASRAKLRVDEKALRNEIISTRFPASAKGFRAALPYNDLHRRILALNAHALQARGLRDLVVWGSDRYAPLAWYDAPERPESPTPTITTMRNEHRADVINLTNATHEAMPVSFRITDLPGGANPSWLSPHQVEMVDTREGVVYATALVELAAKDGMYHTSIPAGATRQLWLASHVRNVAPGDYTGRIELTASSGAKVVPMALNVHPQTMPEQLDTAAGVFDYANGKNYLVTETNLQACLADLRSHHVNAPWGAAWAVLFPSRDLFDDQGNLTKAPDFAAFDAWIAAWPNARRYGVYLAASPTSKFGGRFGRGTVEFNKALTQWAAAWQTHNRELGLEPGRVVLHLVDEVHTRAQLEASIQWCQAFKAAAPDMAVFNDPLLANISGRDWPLFQKLLEHTDIVCPQPTQYLRASPERKAAIQRFASAPGKELWFYMCSGPARKMDPAYYRLQPQYGFTVGATGSAFWAYGDARCESSWNEYPAVGNVGFTPVYLTRSDVTPGKHWEALREGLQDTQYLIMLGADQADQPRLRILRDKLAKAYQTAANVGFDWCNANACATADAVRVEVLELLRTRGPR
jgi:hypothetical protein